MDIKEEKQTSGNICTWIWFLEDHSFKVPIVIFLKYVNANFLQNFKWKLCLKHVLRHSVPSVVIIFPLETVIGVNKPSFPTSSVWGTLDKS